MIKSKDEILTAIRGKLGEDTDDDSLALIEDVTDTFNDLEEKGKGQEDWKKKYEDNDKEWRQKYRDRFYAPTSDYEEDDFEEEKPAKLRFEDLFKTEV
mgnify:CR=1 FL=1